MAQAEDAAGRAEVAHAERDGRLGGILQEGQDAQIVGGALGGDDDLDQIGVLLAHLLVDELELFGHLADVVIADDALGFAEAWDLIDDVDFQIDEIEARDDGLAQEHHALLLGAGPASAVLLPAIGGDHRAGAFVEQALEVGGLGEEVEPQLDQLGALLGGFLNLRLHHAMARAGDDGTGDGRGECWHG